MTYLTTKDLESILHISHNTAYKLMKKKGFPAVKIANKYLVEEEALKQYLKDYIGQEIYTT